LVEALHLPYQEAPIEADEAVTARRQEAFEGLFGRQVAPVFEPLLHPSRYKGGWGGRGSAKSHTFAELLLARCAAKPGSRWVCVREVQHSLKESVKRLLEDKIDAFGLGGEFMSRADSIRTPGNGSILFQGMQNHTAHSIKSLEGIDGAWVEEAQSLSKRSLDLLRPTIRKPDSEIWFSWNPKNPTDPVDAFLRSSPAPPGAIVVKANYSDNPWFSDVLRAEMEWDRQRDPDKYAHVWLGEYERNSEARVFKNWRVGTFETPRDASFLFGGDFGFSVDPTTGIRAWVKGRTLYVDDEVYKVGCEIDHTPALFDQLGRHDSPPRTKMAREWRLIADSARPETISYLRRNGYPRIRPARKGPGSIEEGIEFLKTYDIVVHERCTHTIDDLTLYSFKTDPLTGLVIPQLQDKKNNMIDALRYAAEAVRFRAGGGSGSLHIPGF
jgi:phage terminase large subunit